MPQSRAWGRTSIPIWSREHTSIEQSALHLVAADRRTVQRSCLARRHRAGGASSSASPPSTARRDRLRDEDSVDAGAARVSPAADQRRRADALGFYQAARAQGDFDAGHSRRARAGARQPRFSVPDRDRSRRRRPRHRLPPAPMSSWRRACRSSCGAASRTTNCSTRRFAASCTSRPCSIEKSGGCSPTRARARRWCRTSSRSGCRRATCGCSTPDANQKFPWFDDNLRVAFVREMELFPRRSAEGGPQHRRSADVRRDLPQRTTGAALRDSRRLRQPFPAGDAHR